MGHRIVHILPGDAGAPTFNRLTLSDADRAELIREMKTMLRLPGDRILDLRPPGVQPVQLKLSRAGHTAAAVEWWRSDLFALSILMSGVEPNDDNAAVRYARGIAPPLPFMARHYRHVQGLQRPTSVTLHLRPETMRDGMVLAAMDVLADVYFDQFGAALE